jgi:hypothetical protein
MEGYSDFSSTEDKFDGPIVPYSMDPSTSSSSSEDEREAGAAAAPPELHQYHDREGTTNWSVTNLFT